MQLEEFEKLKFPEIFEKVLENLNISPHKLSIKLSKKSSLPHRAIAEQVKCYQKAKKKLPSFISKKLIFDKIPLEQASSEFTAKYKASLISGNRIIDLTGGLGIDDLFFATSFNKVIYCELNEVTSEIFKHNLKILNNKNIEVNNKDSIELLKNQKDNYFNWIYVDPARRDENRRSVDLQYCVPNVYDNMNLFFQKSENVMIKAAPAFDLTEAVKRFPNLTEIHVISLDGECKEVLLMLNKDSLNIIPKVFSVELYSIDKKRFVLIGSFTKDFKKEISLLKSYFYEPGCSIIKSNLTPHLANKLDLSFFNSGSPFLTSEVLSKDFPGRSFEVITSVIYNEKEIKKYLKQNGITKANITRRDFRLSVDDIRKKFRLKDGGYVYLFFTKDLNNDQIMIVGRRIYKI